MLILSCVTGTGVWQNRCRWDKHDGGRATAGHISYCREERARLPEQTNCDSGRNNKQQLCKRVSIIHSHIHVYLCLITEWTYISQAVHRELGSSWSTNEKTSG